jgi:hypothetical protein
MSLPLLITVINKIKREKAKREKKKKDKKKKT